MVIKRGVIRLVESVIAILIISGVLLLVYANQSNGNNSDEFISDLQIEILSEISRQDELRNFALTKNESSLESYAANLIPPSLDFQITACKLNEICIRPTVDGDLFVEEKLISGNLTEYTPTLIKIFIWEKEV